MRIHRVSALLLGCVLLAACQRAPEPVFHDTYLAFGTLVEVTLHGVAPDYAATVSSELEQQFLRWHHDWHAWEPGPLSALNRELATLQPVTVDAALLPLLTEAHRLARLSGHLFNPVIGRLIALWGFQGNPLPPGTQPDPAAIAAWLADRPTVDDVHLDGNRLRSDNPRVSYDLGGFAKGYAIDRVMAMLHERGIDDAIVNAGGDLCASGSRGPRPWHIGIRHPRRDGLLASVHIRGNTCVFTSGDYERLFENNGKRFHHILDPRTGYPATGSRAVTVVHANGALADAAATALFVAGPEQWQAVAARMGVERALLVDSDGKAWMSPDMAEDIELAEDIDAMVLTGAPVASP